MPNYCTNELFILGNKEQITELKKQLIVLSEDNHEQITFENIFPTPEALVNLTSPTRAEEGETEEQFELRNKTNLELYGATDWYNWRWQNWGTKWDSCDTFYIDNKKDYELKIGFSTAWAPPIGVLEKIGELYPELEITCYYMEEGVGFCGMFYTHDGMSSDEEGEILYRDEEGRELEYDSELGWYRYADTNEIVDEDEATESYNSLQID
jgi:hypothetical protein